MTEQPFNDLTPAEAERLAILAEECGEIILAIGKILRHGYESYHPDGGESNRSQLEIECGHVRAAMIMLCDRGDLEKDHIHEWADIKSRTIKQWLHHQ